MKKLDWYILKKHLLTYVYVVIMIVLVICVIDFTEQNEDFLKQNIPMNEILRDYYLKLIPYYANLLSPLMVFISTVFVTAKLATHTEIIAILASGVSFLRFMRPYLIGSILLAILTFYLTAWVIPDSNKVRYEFEFKYLRHSKRFSDRDLHIKLDDNLYAYIQSYDNTLNNGYKFTLEKIENQSVVEKLSTNKISWNDELQKWTLSEYTIIKIISEKEEEIVEDKNMDTTLNMYPEDFDSDKKVVEALNIDELKHFINEQKRRGADNIEEYEVNLSERYTYPFAVIILSMIGVIVSARKSRQGVGFQIALGFILAFVFIIFVVLSRNLALVGDLSPTMAAWAPTVIFSFIGIFLYKYVPK